MKVKHILLAALCCASALCAQAQSKAAARTFTRSKVLIEKHTGLACPNCPDGDRALREYIERHPDYADKFVEMRHNNYHSFDNYFVDFQLDISDMWRVDGWPRYFVDRCDPNGNRYTDPRSYGMGRGEFDGDSTDEIGNRLNKLTNVSIALTGSSYNPTSKTLNIRVSGEVTASLPNLHINIFLLQDDDRFEGTSRAFLTKSVHGDWLPVSGGRYDVMYSYVIPDKIRTIATDPSRMRVVAFVSSFDDADFTFSEVHNCDVVSVTTLPSTMLLPRQQCAAPTIEIQGQNLVMKSKTPGASYFYSVTSNVSADLTTTKNLDLSRATFTVTAYAGAPGYTDSREVTKTFTLLDLIGDLKDVNGDGTVSIADIPALIKLLRI